MTAPHIAIRPLGSRIGAELTGIDASKPVPDSAVQTVREALNRYGVVVLRGQTLTPQHQVALVRQLGVPRVSFLSEFSVPGAPELTTVSNIRKEGKPIGLVDAGALWHTDGSYLPQPDMYTVLYALEIPRQDGKALGDTLFLSTEAAYDTLSADLRGRLNTARAVHSLGHNADMKRKANLSAPPVATERDAIHPVIRRHPFTGRPCLFVTEGHTRALLDMDEADSAALLGQVFAHLKNPEFIYRHSWQEGDLLIWDNCSTQHLAITDYGSLARRLHRSGIEGPVPQAAY